MLKTPLSQKERNWFIEPNFEWEICRGFNIHNDIAIQHFSSHAKLFAFCQYLSQIQLQRIDKSLAWYKTKKIKEQIDQSHWREFTKAMIDNWNL